MISRILYGQLIILQNFKFYIKQKFNKLNLNKMKKIFYSLSAMLAVVFAVSCEEAKPVEPATEMALKGEFTSTSHCGAYGWQPGTKVGVFVAGATAQNNLEYAPKQTAQYVEFGMPVSVGEVELVAASTVAVYGKDDNVVYAYAPYSASAADYTAVPLPDITVQETFENAMLMSYWMAPQSKYSFGYAKSQPVKESADTIALGNFTPAFTAVTMYGAALAKECIDETLTKVVITAGDKNIASKNATINLETGEVSGELAKAVEFTFAAGAKVEADYFGDGTSGIFAFNLLLSPAEVVATELTFTFHIGGKTYVFTGTPAESSYVPGTYELYALTPAN